MRVLLISPANDSLRVTEKGGRPKGHRYFRFSMLSLLYVAACSPKDIEIKLVDEQIEPVDFNEDVDLVGISFMTALAPRAYQLADQFRRRGVKVVCGGFHPSLYHQEVLAHADSVCVGEAEATWPRLLEDFRSGRLQHIYRAEKRVELAKINFPRRDLLKRKYYAPAEAVQTSRGCYHRCEFCSVTAFFGGTHCRRPVEDVVRELSRIKNRRIIFVDDNIVADREYARKLFLAMAPLKKKWVAQAGIYIAEDLALVKLAKKSGCLGLFIGLETLNEKNLATMQKGFNQAQNFIDNIKVLHRFGIGVEAAVIFGFDHDDKTVFKQTLDFLLKSNIEAIQASILTPLPGTPLYEQRAKEGRIIDKQWDHYDYRQVVLEPKLMRREELQAGADWVINKFYSPLNILKRVISSALYLGLRNALVFCLGLNYAYWTRVRQWRIKGAANVTFGPG